MKKVDAVIAFFAAAVILFGIFQAVYMTITKRYACELNRDASEIAQERQRLTGQFKPQEAPEKPAVAVVEAPQTPVFEPLDVPLDEDLQRHAWTICQREGIPYPLFAALMWGESGCIPDVADNVNADGSRDRGLCQINEANWEWLAEEHGLDVNDPYDNIEAGVIILAMFWHKYPPEQALTAYAWGERGMLEAGEVAPSARRVLQMAAQYESEVIRCSEN